MSFDMNFTIGIASMDNLKNDIRYIKSTLLYADTITLISPIAHTYFKLTDDSDRINEKSYINLLLKILPFCELVDPKIGKEARAMIEKFNEFINNKNYKSSPFFLRYQTKNKLIQFGEQIIQTLNSMLGEGDCKNLKKLVNEGKIKLHNFICPLNDTNHFIVEFCNILKSTITNPDTFPLFDEQSNNLIRSAIEDNVITLNCNNEFNIRHSAVTNDLLLALPSFEYATIDEILDIRKSLENELVRFRGKMLEYNSIIQSMPWDENFKHDCNMLYQKIIAPSILELNELTKENNFTKNLGYNLLNDESFIKGIGGLVISVAAAGTISSYVDAVSSDVAMLSAGGTYATSKILKTYKEHTDKKNQISKKDMYFYYKAGNILKDKYK